MPQFRIASVLLVPLLCATAGCASYPRTGKLETYDLSKGYRFEQLPQQVGGVPTRNSDDLFVVLAFSGGGTRAAALSYGVLDQLRHIRFHWDAATGEPVDCTPPDSEACRATARTLLDEVDVISSVSGGSFTAAYYALNGSAIFDAEGPFRRRFLYHPVQRDLLAEAVYYPANWPRLRARPEIAANIYAEHIFGDATFRALESRPRPYLIVNATDMSTGARFEFTQEQFDLLCADLGSIPIARGVAASSAFPGLLNSLTINSFNTPDPSPCKYTGPGTLNDEDWVRLALKSDPLLDRHFAARQVMAYRDPARQYLHLLDGGLADNIGARALVRGISSIDRPVHRVKDPQKNTDIQVLGGWSALSLLNQKKTKTVLVILVNAKTNRVQDWDTKPAGPGTGSVLNVASGVPMGNFSRETIVKIRDLLTDIKTLSINQPGGARLYGVEVAFEHIESPDEKAFFSDLGTNFDLDPYEVDCLVDRGARLLREATFIEPTGRGFTSFVSDDLKKGTMSRPPGPSPACTKKDGEGRIAVRNHYMDIGFQLGASLPGSNDVDDAELNAGVTFKVTRPHGWGVVVDVGPQSFPIVADLGGARTPLGDLRLWSFMGGIGRTRVMRRAEATLGVSAGFGLGSFVVSPEAGDTFGRAGLFGLDADASSTWLVKPQASFWYNLTNRWAATVSASYVFSRPTIRITSTDGTAFDRRVEAAAFRVGAGIGIKIF